MIRQARSAVTRARIIASAVELFDERGYPATALGDVIERAGMTKGAFYYHFDSKEALAAEIVLEGGGRLSRTFDAISASRPPALEGIIHGTYLVVDQVRTDELARVGTTLLRMFAGYSEPAEKIYTGWLHNMAVDVARARDEGDLREDVDVDAVANTFVGGVVGGAVLSDGTSHGADLRTRVTHMFALVLPTIVAEGSAEYFTEFLSREAGRHPR